MTFERTGGAQALACMLGLLVASCSESAREPVPADAIVNNSSAVDARVLATLDARVEMADATRLAPADARAPETPSPSHDASAVVAAPARSISCSKRWPAQLIHLPGDPEVASRFEGPVDLRSIEVGSGGGVRLDEHGNVFLVGSYLDAIDLGVGALPIVQAPEAAPNQYKSRYQGFVLELDASCTPRWSRGVLPGREQQSRFADFVDIDAARGLVRVGLHASPRVGPSLLSLDDDCVLASFDLGGNPLDDRSFPVPPTFQSGPFPALGPYALGADGALRVDSYGIEKDWLPVGNRAVRSWWPGSFPLDGSVQRADFGDDTREERDTVAIGADGTTTWAGSRADGFTFAGQRIEAPTPKFAFIANLDTQGKPRWHATVRAFDKGVPAFFPTLARDVDGSSYLSALFDEDPVQLDPSYVGPVVPPDRQYSWLLRKYGPQGELMWEKLGAVAGTSKGLTTLLAAAGGALAIALVNVDLVDLGKERVQADGSTLLLELDTNGELRRTQKLEDGVSALSLNVAGELVIAGQGASTGGDYDLFVTKFAR